MAPAATVTDAGTVSAALFEEIATAAPPAGAAMESVTVQVELAPAARLVGAHWKPEIRACKILIVPPAPVTAAEVPPGSDPITLLSGSETVAPLVADNVTVATATTPVLMVLAFNPLATHVTNPAPGLQFRVLAAAVRAGPAAMLTETTSVGAYERVHCRADGMLPAVFKVRFKETTLPRTAEPDARLRELLWASAYLPNTSKIRKQEIRSLVPFRTNCWPIEPVLLVLGVPFKIECLGTRQFEDS